jgi:hypothetical protein
MKLTGGKTAEMLAFEYRAGVTSKTEGDMLVLGWS